MNLTFLTIVVNMSLITRYSRFVIIVLLIGFMPFASIADDIEDGLLAYKQGDYQTAIAAWSLASQQGNIDADFHLAELYRLGKGVPQDNLRAESSYLKAAQQNHVSAQLNLGKLYYFGALGADQKQKAFYWLQKAAQQNNADAQWMLGGMLFNGEGGSQNSAAAYSWLTLASDQNHLQAALNLAKIKAHLTAEQHDLAQQLTDAFRANNNAKDAIIKQQQQAYYWFHQAAQKNDPQAQWMVAKMLLNGQGVEQDKVAAYSWLTLASEQNQSDAGLKLAQLKSELSQQQIALADSLTAAFKQQGSMLNEQPQINFEKSQQDAAIQQNTEIQKDSGTQHLYRVQVASFTSLLDVDIELVELHKKFPSIMDEQAVTITEPDPMAQKPDFYRIQLGAFNDKNAATKLCQNLDKRKQACFVVKEDKEQ